jgi:hypothetical protein
VKKIRKTWTLGVVQAVSVLFIFGPSLFGYKIIFRILYPKSFTFVVITHGFIIHLQIENQYCIHYKIFDLFFIYNIFDLWFLYFIVFIVLLCIIILGLNSPYTLFLIYWHLMFLFLNFKFHVYIRSELIDIDQYRVSFKLFNGHQ